MTVPKGSPPRPGTGLHYLTNKMGHTYCDSVPLNFKRVDVSEFLALVSEPGVEKRIENNKNGDTGSRERHATLRPATALPTQPGIKNRYTGYREHCAPLISVAALPTQPNNCIKNGDAAGLGKALQLSDQLPQSQLSQASSLARFPNQPGIKSCWIPQLSQVSSLVGFPNSARYQVLFGFPNSARY